MVELHWRAFRDEIDRWRHAGRDVEFWWRDDDACRPDPVLSRLCALSGSSGVPLALAAIPAEAEKAAFDGMPASVTVIQHGADHRNRARATQKKTEFPPEEAVAVALRRLASGRERLQAAAGGAMAPVLAPPWNRVHPALAASLGAAGYWGLSTYGARKLVPREWGLVQVNTHVDIIDWKGTRGFVGEVSALGQATRHLVARREGAADAGEPVGWLTHHAVHDEAAWAFLAKLFEMTQAIPGVRWRTVQELFGKRK